MKWGIFRAQECGGCPAILLRRQGPFPVPRISDGVDGAVDDLRHGGTALAASMETVNIGGNNNYGSAASPPTIDGGGTMLEGIGDSGNFVSPPRSPRPGSGRAIPRAPFKSGSWSKVSEASAGDFVIVDALDKDGIEPRRLREAVASGVVVGGTAGGPRGSVPGTTGGGGGSVPGRRLPA